MYQYKFIFLPGGIRQEPIKKVKLKLKEPAANQGCLSNEIEILVVVGIVVVFPGKPTISFGTKFVLFSCFVTFDFSKSSISAGH